MFWTNFVYLCDSVDMSPNRVAKELGVKSSGTVTKWAGGTTVPRAALLMKIADRFGITTEDLLHTDLRAKKMPSLVSEEEHKKYSSLGLEDLSDEELGFVKAYIAGLKTMRKG